MNEQSNELNSLVGLDLAWSRWTVADELNKINLERSLQYFLSKFDMFVVGSDREMCEAHGSQEEHVSGRQ